MEIKLGFHHIHFQADPAPQYEERCTSDSSLFPSFPTLILLSGGHTSPAVREI